MANLEIKRIPSQNNPEVIGNYPLGGIVKSDEKFYWLRHPSFRWNGQSWGWKNNGFSRNDISEVGYHLTPHEKKLTFELAQGQLSLLKEGGLPQNFTIGVEIEGCLYDREGNLMPKYDSDKVTKEGDTHPELLHFTVETATEPINGHQLQSPVEIAHALSAAVLEGYEIAEKRGGLLVYSSVPEGGSFDQAMITPHPYLLSFAPKVLDFTLKNWDKIPQEAKDLYNLLGVNILDYFQETGILNWPVNALHVHNGVAQIEGLADTRIAYAYGIIRLTEFAKLFSLLLYNTSYFYGVDTGLKDVRSIVRRLLATTIDASLPENADKLIKAMTEQLTYGQIHSPSRFPSTGQHDRVRFRAEKQYKTVESIDAPMTPDLRFVLGWVFFNQILNVIAMEAVANTQGDEFLVINYLQKKWGNIFSIIPTLGKGSSFEFDLVFNQQGFEGEVNGKKIKERLLLVKNIIDYYSNNYQSLRLQGWVVSQLIELVLNEQNKDLKSYLGMASGIFSPNNQYKGIITEAKEGYSLEDLINVQSKATYEQALWLKNIIDEMELLSFFGL